MDMFKGFETIDGVDNDAVQLVYGVNVIRVDATATVARTATIGELVEDYRERLALPADAVVFVDGVQMRLDDDLPADCRRVEVVKPAGVKGAGDIPLTADDAARVEVVRRDQIVVVAGRTTEYVEIGAATRRADGTVTLNDVVGGADEAYVNGGGDWACRALEPGDHIVVVIPGETREITLAEWTSAEAHAAEGAMVAYEEELDELPFADLRARARNVGIAASGAGRTRAAITADLVAARREALYSAIAAGPPQPPTQTW